MGIAFDIKIRVCSYNRRDIISASAQVFTEILHTGIDAEIGVICFSGFDSISYGLLPTQAASQTVRDFFSPQLPTATDDNSADIDMKQIWHDYDMKQGY